jgi:hypothetical protein
MKDKRFYIYEEEKVYNFEDNVIKIDLRSRV